MDEEMAERDVEAEHKGPNESGIKKDAVHVDFYDDFGDDLDDSDLRDEDPTKLP